MAVSPGGGPPPGGGGVGPRLPDRRLVAGDQGPRRERAELPVLGRVAGVCAGRDLGVVVAASYRPRFSRRSGSAAPRGRAGSGRPPPAPAAAPAGGGGRGAGRLQRRTGSSRRRGTPEDLAERAVSGAFLRYRIMVYVGVPLQYAANAPGVVQVVGPIHGALYIVYLLAAADLARRARFGLLQLAAMVAAGFVPLLAFVMERQVAHRLAREHPVEAAVPGGQSG